MSRILRYVVIASLLRMVSCSNYSVPVTTFGPTFRNATLMQQINITYFDGSLPVINYSWPILKIASCLSLSGATSAFGNSLRNFVYPFYVDMINLQGGIVIQGQNHLLQIVVADDESSTQLMQSLYSSWIADSSISLLITPQFDSMQRLLNPMIGASGRFWFNFVASSPSTFVPPYYPYLVTTVNTKDQLGYKALDLLNQRAHAYHHQVSSQTTYDVNTKTSPYGISSICAFLQIDDMASAVYKGLFAWVAGENGKRTASGAGSDDLIKVVYNATWSTIDETVYARSMSQCPDKTDVLFAAIAQGFPSCQAVANSMASAQVRPRSAWSSCSWPNYDTTNAEMVLKWSGWTGIANMAVSQSTLPKSAFNTLQKMNAVWFKYFGTPAVLTHGIYVGGLDMLVSILSTTTSLSLLDMRNATMILSSDNPVALSGRNLTIDPIVGVNRGSVTYLGQLYNNGVHEVGEDFSSIIYPYNWPWVKIEIGDPIHTNSDRTATLIGAVLSVLGCWVGVILIEQAVFVKRRNGFYQFWLAIVTLAIGGAGVWCSYLMQSAGLNTVIPGANVTQPVEYSVPVAVLGLLPALSLIFSGMTIMIGDIGLRDSKPKQNKASDVRQQQHDAAIESRKRVALTHRAHLTYLFESISKRVIFGWLLVAVGISLTRYTMMNIWVQKALFVQSATGWIVSVMGHVLLTLPALLLYFHAVIWRFMAVFLLAGAVMLDWLGNLSTSSFTLLTTPPYNPPALYDVLNTTQLAVQLISGILAMVLCFIFIGLQFSRMQLSRNGLAVLVASMENVVHKQKESLLLGEQRNAVLQTQADQLVRIIECINMLSPVPKQYAYTLAINATTSTARLNYDLKLASSGMVDCASKVKESDILSAGSSASKSLSTGRMILAISNKITVDQRDSGLVLGGESKILRTKVASVHPTSLLPVVDDPQSQTDDHSVSNTLDNAEECSFNPNKPQSALRNIQAYNIEPSTSGSRDSLRVWSKSTTIDHAQRVKHYEAECLSMLAVQSSAFKNSVDFSTSQVGFPSAAITSDIGRRSMSLSTPTPSLRQLLQHPICIEMIKAELEQLHCAENVIFLVHVARYRRIENAQLRGNIAREIYRTFIQENSELQVNINTRQRESIAAVVNRRGDTCSPTLFQETEQEILMLLETNLMKKLVQSRSYRLMQWIFSAVDVQMAFHGYPSETSSVQTVVDTQSAVDAVSMN